LDLRLGVRRIKSLVFPKTRGTIFSPLSANKVGGEGRGEVARELKHPAPGDENHRCQNHFGAKSIHCQSFLIGV
jgi:hypothetical protein